MLPTPIVYTLSYAEIKALATGNPMIKEKMDLDVEVEKPFAKEDELKAKTARLDELNALLNMDGKERNDTEKEESREKEYER